MTAGRVTVVDYGVGNLYSVRRALEVCGADEVVVTSRPDEIAGADRLILPGVGAFADGMQGLRSLGLIEPIHSFAESGRPLLGICLGMQMLATASDEFGTHEGLGLIPGKVVPIPRTSRDGAAIKVPFIGWTPLSIDNPHARAGSCLEALGDRDAVYLVHSFHVVPDDPSHLLASYTFGGHPITAAIRRDNVYGFQFHPEKSARAGLAIMRAFVGQR